MSYLLFTTLFLAGLAFAVRPLLARRQIAWPLEAPDARDDVARCQCRAQSGVAAPDHNYVVFLHLISLPRIHVDKLPGATNKMPATPAML